MRFFDVYVRPQMETAINNGFETVRVVIEDLAKPNVTSENMQTLKAYIENNIKIGNKRPKCIMKTKNDILYKSYILNIDWR